MGEKTGYGRDITNEEAAYAELADHLRASADRFERKRYDAAAKEFAAAVEVQKLIAERGYRPPGTCPARVLKVAFRTLGRVIGDGAVVYDDRCELHVHTEPGVNGTHTRVRDGNRVIWDDSE